MAFPSSYPSAIISDIVATTIDSRSRKISDNVSKNNAILAKLSARGNIRTFSGGTQILEEISFAENSNAGWYSGYDLLPVGTSDVIGAAIFQIKQAAVPVVISGLEMLQNSGKEALIDLMEARVKVAENTMSNLISAGLYSDGSGAGGKQLQGLLAAVPLVNNTGTYGGIDRSVAGNAFWRNKTSNQTAATAANIQGFMNGLWAQLVRGSDRPDLIMMDSTTWAVYVASLQTIQRFNDPKMAELGFVSIKYMDADVVLDGGIGGFCPAGTSYFLNTNYLFFRPHAQRNMVALAPNKRYATNQDAEVQILGFAGNMTCSGAQFQGILDIN